MTAPDDPLPLPLDEPRGQRRVRCRVCKRPLTGRTARLWGLGEDCRQKLQERTARRPGGFVVEQEGLPGV
jgi:hypothetical protein